MRAGARGYLLKGANQVETLVATVKERAGRLDVLITCAGIQFATGATAVPMLRKGPQTGVNGGAKGQKADSEDPK